MTPQPGKQTIAIHILPNISRNKSSQTMKFGQLIENNMETFFFKNHKQNDSPPKNDLQTLQKNQN